MSILYVNGHSLLARHLEERQAVLWALQPVLRCDAVKLTEGFPASKSNRLMKACSTEAGARLVGLPRYMPNTFGDSNRNFRNKNEAGGKR